MENNAQSTERGHLLLVLWCFFASAGSRLAAGLTPHFKTGRCVACEADSDLSACARVELLLICVSTQKAAVCVCGMAHWHSLMQIHTLTAIIFLLLLKLFACKQNGKGKSAFAPLCKFDFCSCSFLAPTTRRAVYFKAHLSLLAPELRVKSQLFSGTQPARGSRRGWEQSLR